MMRLVSPIVAGLEGEAMAAARFPILWLEYISDEQSFFMGICGKTWLPFTIMADPVVPLVVSDLYVYNRNCEEGGRCLNTGCELNRTTVATYRRAMGWKGRPVSGFEIRPITLSPDLQKTIEYLKQKYQGADVPASSSVH